MEDIGFTLDQKKKSKKEMSGNINEVIRAVLNSFFLQKDFRRSESTKRIKSTESIKSTKRHKDTRAKAQKRK